MNGRAVIAACALALFACAQRGEHVDVDPAPSAASLAPGVSIYPLALPLRDQDGRAIGLDAYRGQPVVISMFYASCPMACPMLVANVKRLEAQLPPEVRRETRVLLVSFDPKHDTPEVLRDVRARHELDPSRATIATGDEADVRALAAALGISYRALPEGGFSHSSVIVALDRDGRILARVEGTTPDLAPLASALSQAAR